MWTLHIIFTRSVNVQFADWVVVDRLKYMPIQTGRKQCCSVICEVKIHHDGAEELLPVNGVPVHNFLCAQEVEQRNVRSRNSTDQRRGSLKFGETRKPATHPRRTATKRWAGGASSGAPLTGREEAWDTAQEAREVQDCQ